jgi:hypothetical protein
MWASRFAFQRISATDEVQRPPARAAGVAAYRPACARARYIRSKVSGAAGYKTVLEIRNNCT